MPNDITPTTIKRGRGRPKGSRNLPKEPSSLPPIGVRENEACRLIGVGKTKLKELRQKGEVRCYIDGSRVRYFYQSLVDYAARNAAAADQRAPMKAPLPPKRHPGGDT